jgi:hypothetical protein
MVAQQILFDGPQPGEYEVSPGYAVRACASCGAPITWVETAAGKAIPLTVASIRTIDGARYGMTHFTTCPHAREWRKAK